MISEKKIAQKIIKIYAQNIITEIISLQKIISKKY